MCKFWSKVRNVFWTLVRPARRLGSAQLIPSALQRELKLQRKVNGSANPFFNFLADVRRQASEGELYRLRVNESIQRSAGRLWKSMTDEQKLPYREMAIERRRLDEERRRRDAFLCLQRRKRRMIRQRAQKLRSTRKCKMVTYQKADHDENDVNAVEKGYVEVKNDKVDEEEDEDKGYDAGESKEEEG